MPEWQEHETIWLQPSCGECAKDIERTSEGRLWCQDPQEPCEQCGKEWVKFALVQQPSRKARYGQQVIRDSRLPGEAETDQQWGNLLNAGLLTTSRERA